MLDPVKSPDLGAHPGHARKQLEMPIDRIVFVSYGEFDINSAGHIAGFANGLVRKGYQVGVCAGKVQAVDAFGAASFECFAIQDFIADADPMLGFGGPVRAEETVIMCWTPREVVRKAVEPAAQRHGIPYVVHFEDNELHLTQTWMNQRDKGSGKAQPAKGLGRFFRRSEPSPVRSIPSYLTDPARLGPFLAGAAGATLIEERITELLPAALPKLVLEPGADRADIERAARAGHRSEVRRAIGLSDPTTMVFYPGNVHFANVDDVRELYRAIGLLRDRGRDVVLVRTGKDAVEDVAFLSQASPTMGVVTLGQVERALIFELLAAADLFIQPGRPGPFNDYRLPSKLPEFLATGRPVILPATNVGNRLRHGVDAMLLHNGSAEEIAENAGKILDDPALAARLAHSAKEFAERTYSWDRQVEKLEAFLRVIARS